MTAQRTATAYATITPRLLPVSVAEGGPRSSSRSGDSRAETIVGHAYRTTRMLVPSDTDASVVRYESTFRPIRTSDDGQERANNGQNICRRWSERLTKITKRMLEMVINLVEVIIIIVEVIINLAEMVIILAEIVINLVEVVINLVGMVRMVAERISVIIGRVTGMATVKSRTLGTASSVGSIGGVVVVATAVYTLLIYIGGSVCTVSRRINAMPGRVNMVDGRGCMVVANAKAVVGRGGSAVGSVRTKAIKKGSTEALPLDILLI